MKNFASPRFWSHYQALPAEIRGLADKNFDLLRRDPRHPSLRLKKVGVFWSARVGLDHRAIAKERPEVLLWIWIGSHDEYERLIA